MTIQTFKAQLSPAEGRSMIARAIPYGETIEHNGQQVTFDAGSVTVPKSVVPLTVDHGDGSTDRIGKLERWFDEKGAGFAEFTVSETSLGSDILTLLHDEVLTDVSIGVLIDDSAEFEDDAGVLHRSGTLDHVSVVGKGAFGSACAGSKVLSVHSQEKEPHMADEKVEAVVVDTYDDTELVAEIVTLNDKIDKLEASKVVSEPELFEDMKDFILTSHYAGAGNQDAVEKMAKSDQYEIETFAMSNDDTTTAGGVVPNFLHSRILGLLEGSRPTVDAFPKLDPGDYGMSVVLPNVTTEAAVAAQSAGGDQPNSTEMVIGTSTFALETYAGANRVNVQLIERSSPLFVDRLFESLVSSYSTVTDAAFNAALVAGVGTNTAVLASFSADPTATYAAILAGVQAIGTDTKRAADRLIVGSEAFYELLANLDSEDRPLINAFAPVNAVGIATGNAWNFDYAPGLAGIFDPHAAAASALIAWSGAAASLEVPLPRLSVSKVEFASMDLGIIGLFSDAILYGGNTGGLYSLTAA